MKPLFRVDLHTLRHDGLRLLFEAVERSANAMGVDFFLIGALARDAWFVHNNIISRSTTDVDFAVLVSTPAAYTALKQHLVREEKFSETNDNQFILFSPQGVQVDLLPFGEIEIEGKVLVKGLGLSQIAVDGFQEVYKSGTEQIQFGDRIVFKVCSLAGVVILKLIAYDDRPEVRQKDITDINQIINNYFEIESDLIYEHHNDLFDDQNTDLLLLAARVLGRQMKQIIANSPELEERIIRVLRNATDNSEKSRIPELMMRGTDKTVEEVIVVLSEIINGMNDPLS